MTGYPFGETVTARRWAEWSNGQGVGQPQVLTVAGLAVAPRGFTPQEGGQDPAQRRGHVIPQFDVYGPHDMNLRTRDLVERADGTVFEVAGSVNRWRNPLTGTHAGAVASFVQLVDDGPETIRVFTSVTTTDEYGNHIRGPSPTGVEVANVTIEPLAAAEDVREGQEAPNRYRIVGRGLDALDAYAEVEWPVGSGHRFDVVGVPIRWPWPPHAAYTQATLVERR